MKNLVSLLVLIVLMSLMVSCKSAYGPSAVRASSDLGITYLLEEGKLTAVKAKEIRLTIGKLLLNEDLTIIMYNDAVKSLLMKYQGSAQLASALLITTQGTLEQKLTPEYKYIVRQGLSQMDLAVREWETYKKLK